MAALAFLLRLAFRPSPFDGILLLSLLVFLLHLRDDAAWKRRILMGGCTALGLAYFRGHMDHLLAVWDLLA